MQIQTDKTPRDEVKFSTSEKPQQAAEKSVVSGPTFMDLMKSIQLRSQQVLEENKNSSEPKHTVQKDEPEEQDLFEAEEEEKKKNVKSSEAKEISKILSLFPDEDTEFEESPLDELEDDLTENEAPLFLQMTAFLQSIEMKKEKPANKEEEVQATHSKKNNTNLKQVSKEEETQKSQEISAQPELEKKASKEPIPFKQSKQNTEKEISEETSKKLEDLVRWTKPGNEEKAALKEVPKEHNLIESENWKITREKKQESFTQIQKSNANKISAAEESSSKGDNSSSGKGQTFQQDSFSRQGTETTFSLLKNGIHTVEKEASIQSARSESSKPSSTNTVDRNAMRENMQRLVQSARLHIVENGKSEATLRLNPQELGRVSLRISVEEDRVQGRIVVESEEVKKLFSKDLEQLRKEFKDQGLILESLLVEVDEVGQFAFGFDDRGSNGAEDRNPIQSDLFENSKEPNSASEIAEAQEGSTEIPENAEKNKDRRINILV
ncbi:hypothetical protein CH373_08625 [Leptospira perolatii]|uniref:Flagellar hook-length control protein-like C-terminal domain-containing protein n=1 Tax=Leptospira perolatii TaxID=2023191 RepID=A0A2M9ZP44_9LEPT|nr:flagellar hook-length control protein FliK [Leptospira perolatii]PJZ69686.1 hypothetical protein CH360_09770 [Leptospira perolatii]PJZ73693.1 hypothetical protein CH373_08625 [Leptospira perolatii]